MKRLLVIFLILSHALMLGAGWNCTIWRVGTSTTMDPHESGTHLLVAAVSTSVHSDDGHDHEEDGPEHTHVLQPDLARKAPRAELEMPPLAVPAAYVRLSELLVVNDRDRSTSARADEGHRPTPAPPLAGRTSNLLF